jgi:hypothetical protein
VYWLKTPFTSGGKTWPAGTIYIPARPTTAPLLQRMAKELGLTFEGTGVRPTAEALKLRPVRIGLWDRYGGSMPSGWVRWLLERFEFPFEVVYAPALDAGNLSSRFDVLLFVSGAIPERDPAGGGQFGLPSADSVPAEFRDWLGNVTVSRTVPQLRSFLEDGGTILTIGSSTVLAAHLGLGIADHLVEKLPGGGERALPREKYYVPGSILQVNVDTSAPLAYGMKNRVDVFFNNSPVMKLTPEALMNGVRPVAWFSGATPLRSGWAWGQHFLDGGVAVAEAPVGKGRLFLYGPEVTFRAQPHGTFKLVFNGIFYGTATTTRIGGRASS